MVHTLLFHFVIALISILVFKPVCYANIPDENKLFIPSDTIPVILTRNFSDSEVSFLIDTAIEKGMTKVVWNSSTNSNYQQSNHIVQIAPYILLYKEYPDSLSNRLFGECIVTKIEFMDSSYQTKRIVDVWNNMPFMRINNIKRTYNHFDAEGMSVLPYDKQVENIIPNEHSIFIWANVIGNYLILSYKQLEISEFTITGMKTTIMIYNMEGEIIAEVNNVPNWDKGVVSPNGLFMMYIFGGDIPTVNQPFAKLEKTGWAIMDLKTQSILYTEFEKEGTHLDGVFYVQGLLEANSTTPFENEYYDYKVFFDEISGILYKKLWLQSEWNEFVDEWKQSKNDDWRYYLNKYNFEKIIITLK